MALWICIGCTCAYSVGAARCPQCGESDHVEEGAAEMAKITVHGGPSIASEKPEAVAEPDVSEEPTAESSEVEETEKAPRRRTRSK